MSLRALRCLVLAVFTTLAWLGAFAQQSGKIAHVGYLSPGAGYPFDAFREELRDLGYVEGRNIVIERRSAEGDPQRLAQLAADLAGLPVDVIVTATTAATQAAQRATTTIPIVFALADDPTGLGLVSSLARPGGNITGLTGLMVELTGKRLELLKEAMPNVKRVGVLVSPYSFSPAALKEATDAAGRLGLQLEIIEVRQPADLSSAFAQFAGRKVRALLVLPHPSFVAQRMLLVQLAAKHRLPAIYHLKEFVEVGGLMSYAPDVAHMSRRAATYVDKILKGAKPADLAVEQPTEFEFAVNLKTAKTLGLTFPEALLLRANHVIR
jgi:putative ABC transport system substrate-binding protein